VSLEAPVAVEYLPALQTAQLPCAVAPVLVRYLPALQSVHEVEPVTSLYFPATQAVQIPPFDPVNPGLQRQLVESVEPLGDCESTGQPPQVVIATAPSVTE
jgi:hypothetical protein